MEAEQGPDTAGVYRFLNGMGKFWNHVSGSLRLQTIAGKISRGRVMERKEGGWRKRKEPIACSFDEVIQPHSIYVFTGIHPALSPLGEI